MRIDDRGQRTEGKGNMNAEVGKIMVEHGFQKAEDR